MSEASTCQEAHKEWCSEVTWDNLAWDLLGLPAIVNIAMALVFVVINRIWIRNQKHPYVRAVTRIVGDEELTQVEYPKFLKGCFLLEISMSMWFAFSWAYRTYTHEVPEHMNRFDQLMCAFFMIFYMLNAARDNFAPAFALKATSIITVATVVPTFARSADSSLWFSFGYLRAPNAVSAIMKIERMGALKDLGDISRMYVQLSLRTFALVACLVGTTFALEILGDPESLRDQYIETQMGSLSVVQLTYWIFTTISTVGYGDFAPTTVMSRLFIIMAIAFGVCFFSEEINELVRVTAMESSGRGRYKKKRGTDHCVLIGGGVRQFSSVMQSLMLELFSSDEPRWPDLVIMASAEQPELLRAAIKSFPKNIRNRIRYYMGDPTDAQDMERVQMGTADLVIIIPSLLATDMNSEDEANILRGLAVTSMYPNANLRLMLLRSPNKKVAVQVGFQPSRCFSINEQKSGLFALACCCRGFSTMITSILMPDSEEDSSAGKIRDAWFAEFKQGRHFFLRGFLINPNYAGITFAQFAILCSKRSITPIAVQLDGKLQLAPEHTLEPNDVVFALIRSDTDLQEFCDSSSSWRDTFKSRQVESQCRIKASLLARKSSVDTSGPGQFHLPLMHTTSRVDLALPIAATEPTGKADGGLGDVSVKEKVAILEEKGKRIAEDGGHHILVLMQGSPWQQVQVFLKTLRSDHLPFHIPILVLIPAPLPQPEQILSIFENFPRTAFIKANGGIGDLRASGMTKARCVALLAGNAGQSSAADRRMVDGSGITLMSCIEGELKENECKNVPVFLELHQQESIRFLTRFAEQNDDDEEESGNTDKASFTSHPRFANGNIFTASCFGATVARSFNMPGIVELMEAITLGSANGQTAFPWQLSLPEGFDQRPYSELAASLVETHNAVCLGMYRLCFPETSTLDGSRFVLTNPDQGTILRSSDYIFVLGNAMFGAYCFDKGLLVGAAGAPRSTDEDEFELHVAQCKAEQEESKQSSRSGSKAIPLAPTTSFLSQASEGSVGVSSLPAQAPRLATPDAMDPAAPPFQRAVSPAMLPAVPAAAPKSQQQVAASWQSSDRATDTVALLAPEPVDGLAQSSFSAQ